MRREILVVLAACLLFSAQKAASRDIEITIDRIELIGITVFDRTEIEPALEITAGDLFDRSRAIRTAENLKALYNSRGYEQAFVHTEIARQKGEEGLLENTLRFVVREGKPTRIAWIKLVPRNLRDPGFQKFWERIEPALAGKIGLTAGDIYDQEKISLGKKTLQDALASEEFVGAKVEDVRIESAAVPAESILRAKKVDPTQVARWVSLELEIDLGDRVSFGFRQNTVLTRARLDALIEEQRAIGFGKDYVTAIQGRIADEYRSLGYDQVKVVPYTFENPREQERHVSYEITEGPKVKIVSLDFEGNRVFSNDQLREEFYSHSSPLLQQGIYSAKDTDKAADLLIEWLKSSGYLSAKLITINRSYVDNSRGIRLMVYLYEGEQTLVQTVTFQGLFAFTRDEVLKILNLEEGAPLNLYAFSEGLEKLKGRYRAQGYLDVKIANEGMPSVVVYSQENRYADVTLEIAEGPRYRISEIDIEGLTSTHEVVVGRELQFQVGDFVEEAKIAESESRLRRLGIFASISITPLDDPAREGYKKMRVSVSEGTPGLVEGGVGYRNDLGARVFAQSAYSDLWNSNHTVALTTAANRRFDTDFCNRNQPTSSTQGKQGQCFIEYQSQLGYVWPWVFLGETTLNPRITVSKTLYRRFDATTISFETSLERRLVNWTNLSGALTYGLERIHQFDSAFAVDNQQLIIGSMTPALKLDLRDNSLAPTSGYFGLVTLEYASPFLGSQTDPFPVGYTKIEWRNDYYVPVARDVTWFLSFRTGWERNNESPPKGTQDPRYAIPLIKQFALGGVGSLRGFKEQELNVQDFAIQGTLSYVNYRSQLDLPFAGPLRFGPFVDAANLKIDRYSFGDVRYGVGAGFHYQSPVGPVNFDWGFKVNPRPDEDPYRFYFSIGII